MCDLHDAPGWEWNTAPIVRDSFEFACMECEWPLDMIAADGINVECPDCRSIHYCNCYGDTVYVIRFLGKNGFSPQSEGKITMAFRSEERRVGKEC